MAQNKKSTLFLVLSLDSDGPSSIFDLLLVELFVIRRSKLVYRLIKKKIKIINAVKTREIKKYS